MKNMKRIASITIKRTMDSDPDTSYLGEYSSRAETDYAIDRRHSIDCPVNAGTEGRLLTYISGESGRIELQMTMDQAESVSHSGQCDEDVTALAKVPAIASQLAVIDPASLVQELTGYGAWDETELADHSENLIRFLWLAGCDIKEQDGCDCGERGDAGRNEYRYFNGNVENYKGLSEAGIRKHIREDYDRMERLNRGDWCYMGIRAEAEIRVPDMQTCNMRNVASLSQTITSGGLWGVESDSRSEERR